jgi:RNA polymerase sigma factor (sigma-70 family)
MSTNPPPAGVTQVIRDFRAGNHAAFARLVELYRPRLEAWLERHRGRRRADLNSKEDLAQSVFRNLYQHMAGGPTWIRDMASTDEFEAVLFHLATLRLLHAVQYEERQCRRGTVRDQDVAALDGAALTASLPARVPDPADEAAANLTADEMRARVAVVNPQWVRVFELRLAGRTVDQIAADLGLPPRTVDRALQGIKNVLWAWVEQEWHELGGGDAT